MIDADKMRAEIAEVSASSAKKFLDLIVENKLEYGFCEVLNELACKSLWPYNVPKGVVMSHPDIIEAQKRYLERTSELEKPFFEEIEND